MANLDLLLEAEKRGILPPDKQALLAEARSRGLVPSTPESSDKSGILSKVGAGLLGAAFPPAGTSSVLNEFLTKQPFGSTSPLDVAKNGALTTAAAANTLLAGIPGDLAPQGLQQQYAQALQNNPGPALLGPGTGAALQTMLTGGSGKGLLGLLRQTAASGLGGYSQIANNPESTMGQRGLGTAFGAGSNLLFRGIGAVGDSVLKTKFGQKTADFIRESLSPFGSATNNAEKIQNVVGKDLAKTYANDASTASLDTISKVNPQKLEDYLGSQITKESVGAPGSASPLTDVLDKVNQKVPLSAQDRWLLARALDKEAFNQSGNITGNLNEERRVISSLLRNNLTGNNPAIQPLNDLYSEASNVLNKTKPVNLASLPNVIRLGLGLGSLGALKSGHQDVGILGLLATLGSMSGQYPQIANIMSKAGVAAPQLSQLPPALLQLLQGQ